MTKFFITSATYTLNPLNSSTTCPDARVAIYCNLTACAMSPCRSGAAPRAKRVSRQGHSSGMMGEWHRLQQFAPSFWVPHVSPLRRVLFGCDSKSVSRPFVYAERFAVASSQNKPTKTGSPARGDGNRKMSGSGHGREDCTSCFSCVAALENP